MIILFQCQLSPQSFILSTNITPTKSQQRPYKKPPPLKLTSPTDWRKNFLFQLYSLLFWIISKTKRQMLFLLALNSLREPCPSCAAPYGYHNVMALSTNTHLFAVSQLKISKLYKLIPHPFFFLLFALKISSDEKHSCHVIKFIHKWL